MKSEGAQSGRSGGGGRERVPTESPRQYIAARFPLSMRARARAARVTAASAFARRAIDEHGLPSVPSVAGTLRFLNFVLQGAPEGELPGLGAGMVYREPGATSLQWFCTWFLKSVLSLTVNTLEQNFGAWPTRVYVIQAPPAPGRPPHTQQKSFTEPFSDAVRRSHLGHQFYAGRGSHAALHFGLDRLYAAPTHTNVERRHALEYRAHLERLSYPERGLYPEHALYPERARRSSAREVKRELFPNQPAPRGGASPELGTTPGVAERGTRQTDARLPGHAYAEPAARAYSHVLHPPSRRSVELRVRDYLVGVLRAFESRAKAVSQITDGVRAAGPHAHAATFIPGLAGARTAAGAATGAVEGARASAIHFLNLLAAPPSVNAPAAPWNFKAFTAPSGSNVAAATAGVLAAPGQGGAVYSASKGPRAASGETYVRAAAGRGPDVPRQLTTLLLSTRGTTSEAAARPGASLSHLHPSPVPSPSHSQPLRAMPEGSARQRGDDGDTSRTAFTSALIFGRQDLATISKLSPAEGETLRAGTAGGAPPAGARDGESSRFNAGVTTRMPNLSLAAANMLVAGVPPPRPADERESDAEAARFTFLRREGEMRPPMQTYAFAQPPRPAPPDEQMVKQVWEKNVEEIVRKEVAVATKNVTQPIGLTRADYSRIADHVYSSLTRRLMLEKERSAFHR